MTTDFELQSTSNLEKRAHLAGIAIWFAWVGGAFAITACIYTWIDTAKFPAVILAIALFTLALSAPVFRERQKIKKILDSRS